MDCLEVLIVSINISTHGTTIYVIAVAWLIGSNWMNLLAALSCSTKLHESGLLDIGIQSMSPSHLLVKHCIKSYVLLLCHQ